MIAFILSPIGRWLAGAAIFAVLMGANDLYFYNKGKRNVQDKWDAAIATQINKGTKARTDAERSVDSDPDGGLRDNFNRDK